MKSRMASLKETFFTRLPHDLRQPFAVDCAQRNNFRFSILPFFNIFTQIACYIIYLYIYPATYPERPRIDQGAFIFVTVLYIATNLVYIFLFAHVRKQVGNPNYVRNSQMVLYTFLVFYVTYEAMETIIEVEISGNIYRFLATFFMVAFLPVISRAGKIAYLFYFTLFVETGFSKLIASGYDTSNRYQEITFVFFLVCAALSNVIQSNNIRSFMLKNELIEANKKLQEMLEKDPLTDIANRRAFDNYIRRIWDECKRNGSAINAMMIDIDHFKQYNDFYGHLQGDDCLIRVAHFIDGYFARSIDMVARYGGEEFIVLLPYTSPEGVSKLAEGLRKGVEDMNLIHERAALRKVTISVGVASIVPDINGRYEDFIKLADDALYEAKNNGRNQVRYAGELVAS